MPKSTPPKTTITILLESPSLLRCPKTATKKTRTTEHKKKTPLTRGLNLMDFFLCLGGGCSVVDQYPGSRCDIHLHANELDFSDRSRKALLGYLGRGLSQQMSPQSTLCPKQKTPPVFFFGAFFFLGFEGWPGNKARALAVFALRLRVLNSQAIARLLGRGFVPTPASLANHCPTPGCGVERQRSLPTNKPTMQELKSYRGPQAFCIPGNHAQAPRDGGFIPDD